MPKTMKPIEMLDLSDFEEYKVWKFATDSFGDVDFDNVVPIRKEALIESDDVCVLVGFHASLSCGIALKGIVEVNGDPIEILPGPSFHYKGKWFRLMLPPAPELVLSQEGPAAFAKFMGLSESEVFPIKITSDATFVVSGLTLTNVLSNKFTKNA